MGLNFIFQISVNLICLVILFYSQFKFKGRQDKIAKACPAAIILCIFILIDTITRQKYRLAISVVSLMCCIIIASAFINKLWNLKRKR